MAWQSPKIDWQAADGVRNTDFNRIEGNILELYNTESLKAALTLYVSPSGNDTTGTGTSAAPYKTITKALSTVPRNIGSQTCTISIAAGTYNETVTVTGFSGIIRFALAGAVIINKLVVEACVAVFSGGSLTAGVSGDVGVMVTLGATLTMDSPLTSHNGTRGVTVAYDSTFVTWQTLTVNNTTSDAVYVNLASRFFARTLAGSGNTTGIYASQGGIASVGSATITVNGSKYYTDNGARIYIGAQASVPSY